MVLRVREDTCEVVSRAQLVSVRYATAFPSLRAQRVSPGNLVALAMAADGTEAVVWRWFDAVVLGPEDDRVRLWEPGHGEVVAAVPAADSSRTKSGRSSAQPRPPGTRAYASAGLPGADWWVAGAVVAAAEDAAVELDEVEAFCTQHDFWNQLV